MKKNIAKAIKIADSLIVSHIKNADGMENLAKEWTEGSKGLALEIASVHRDVAKCLQMISDLLQERPKRRKIAKKQSK